MAAAAFFVGGSAWFCAGCTKIGKNTKVWENADDMMYRVFRNGGNTA